jgi:hypothetical protein
LIGIFILIVVWFGGEQLIVKPIRALVRTATRFGRGDLRARAAQEDWIAEFEPLAVALDDMALSSPSAKRNFVSPTSTLTNSRASTVSPDWPTAAASIASSNASGSAPAKIAHRSL